MNDLCEMIKLMITAAELKKKLQQAFLNGYNFGRYVIINDMNSGAVVIGDEYKRVRALSGAGIKYMPDEFNYPE